MGFLSDFWENENQTYTGSSVAVSSDIVLQATTSGVHVLQPNTSGHTVTLPSLSDGSYLTIGNDSNYTVDLELDSTNKIRMLANQVVTCFKTDSSWYVVEEGEVEKVPWATHTLQTSIFYSSEDVNNPVICKIDENHIAIFYSHTPNGSSYIFSVGIGTKAGNTFSFASGGANITGYINGNNNKNKICKLDDTHLMITYYDNSNGNYYNILTLDPTTKGITSTGTARLCQTNSSQPINVKNLKVIDSSTVAVDDGQNVVIGNVSGDTVTFGAFNNFSGSSTSKCCLNILNTSNLVLFFQYSGGGYNDTRVYSIVGSISGTSVNFGSSSYYTTSYSAVGLYDSIVLDDSRVYTHINITFSGTTYIAYAIHTINKTNKSVTFGSESIHVQGSLGLVTLLDVGVVALHGYFYDPNSSWGNVEELRICNIDGISDLQTQTIEINQSGTSEFRDMTSTTKYDVEIVFYDNLANRGYCYTITG